MVNLLATTGTTVAGNGKSDPATLEVVLLGMGVVFLGLICIIVLCILISLILNQGKSSAPAPTPAPVPVPVAPVAPAAPAVTEIPDKQAFIAAVSAAIAEDMGTDVSALRILSVKRL